MANPEDVVKALIPSAVIIRFALVLGFARKSGTNAMLDSVMGKWKAGEPVCFSTRETRNPIDAASLARLMITMLADRQVSGLFHVGASDSVSRYELGRRLAARAGVSTDLVQPQGDPPPGRARRTRNPVPRPSGEVLAMFVAALAVRVVYVAVVHKLSAQPSSDSIAYDQLGWNLARGVGFQLNGEGALYPTAKAPLLPYLVSLVYRVTGHVFLAAVLVTGRPVDG